MSFCRFSFLLLCVALAGCRPGATGQGDEQKDPYYLAGKSRLQERNYQGAIDMFEKTLDVNPRSASAHFELGVLYEQQQGDYAAALYHYQKAVTLRSDMPSAELARQRIQECKRELAKTVTQPLSAQNLQRDLDNLREENKVLRQQLQAWKDYHSERGDASSNLVPMPANPMPPSPRPAPPVNPVRSNPPTVTPRTDQGARVKVPPGTSRFHTIAAGETPAMIARKYNIKVSALMSANPTVDATRLRPGRTLIIPPP